MCGLRASRRWIWSSRWTMRRAPFCRVSGARRGHCLDVPGLAEVFGQHGLPLSFYTDRGSHYFHTPEAGGKVDRTRPTQVGRALEHLGVEHIAAYSPQARGRSERVFHTLQDRLVKEFALAGSPRWRRRTCSCAMSISPPTTRVLR